MAAQHVEAFVQEIWPHAVEVGDRYGLDPITIVTQAAIETGWGREVAGNNYFGVKSHGRPGGQVITTHEEIDGERVKVQDSFRVYDSMAESVEDYARFLHENPRYADAIAQQSHSGELAGITAAGYATDSGYLDLVNGVSKMVAEVAPPTPPGEIPNVVATELDVTRPRVAPVPAPRAQGSAARTNAMLNQQAPVPAPASQRPRMVAPRPVSMSAATRANSATRGGTADLALSGRPAAVTPRLRDDGEVLSYHIPDITRTAVVGGVGSLTPTATTAPSRRMLPPLAPPGINPRADGIGSMPALAEVAGISGRSPKPSPGGDVSQERGTFEPPRPVIRQGTQPSATERPAPTPPARPQTYAGQDRAIAASPADVPKYITRTERIEIPQRFAGQDRAKPAPASKEIPLGAVMHHGSRDSVAQRKAGEETAKNMPKFKTRTVTELNPKWVAAQRPPAGPKTVTETEGDFLGGLRQAIGIPAEGFGPSILRAVQNAFGGKDKSGPDVVGFGLGKRKVVPLTKQQIAAAQAQPQNHNPAALNAISEGRKSYSSGGGAVMPTVSMSGKVRNTYGDRGGSLVG